MPVSGSPTHRELCPQARRADNCWYTMRWLSSTQTIALAACMVRTLTGQGCRPTSGPVLSHRIQHFAAHRGASFVSASGFPRRQAPRNWRRLGTLPFIDASCSSRIFESRRPHCVHSRSSLSRSGHCSATSVLIGVLTIQIPTILGLPVLYARSPAILQTRLMGMQCGPRALRIVAPGHPFATGPMCSLECQFSPIPGSGLGNQPSRAACCGV